MSIDLEMLERAWVDAVNRRDAAVVSRIVADDFGGIDSAGNRFTKAAYLLDLRNGDSPPNQLVRRRDQGRILATLPSLPAGSKSSRPRHGMG